MECFFADTVETAPPVFFPSFTRSTLITCRVHQPSGSGTLADRWAASHWALHVGSRGSLPHHPLWPQGPCRPRSAHLRCSVPQIRMRSGDHPRRPLTVSDPPGQSACAAHPCQTSINPLPATLFMRRSAGDGVSCAASPRSPGTGAPRRVPGWALLGGGGIGPAFSAGSPLAYSGGSCLNHPDC